MRNKIKFLTIISAAILAPGMAFSEPRPTIADRDYFTVGNISSTIDLKDDDRSATPPELPVLNTSKSVATATALINTGISAWNVVSGGAPSGSADASYASAIIPGMYLNWSAVAGWKGPKEAVYTYKVTNAMNMDVIKIKYKISFYYGGTESASGTRGANETRGKYITNFTVKALEVDVMWGWHFNLDVKMSNPMNVGTVRRPVAFLQSDLNWRVSNMLSTSGGVWSYTVDGNGNFRDLTSEARGLTRDLSSAPVEVMENTEIAWN